MMKSKVLSLGLMACLGLTGATAVLTGCAGSHSDRTTGQYIDDKTLSYRVSSAVHDDSEYKMGDVDVKAFRGNVQLSGFVATEDQKRRAGDIARNVQGVQSVENNITVKNHLEDNRTHLGENPR
jgi:hyperosmotically inducible periplasmic protein